MCGPTSAEARPLALEDEEPEPEEPEEPDPEEPEPEPELEFDEPVFLDDEDDWVVLGDEQLKLWPLIFLALCNFLKASHEKSSDVDSILKSPSTSFNESMVKLPKLPANETAPLTVSKFSNSMVSKAELLKIRNSPSISVRLFKLKISKSSLAKIWMEAPTLDKESNDTESKEL